MIHPIDTPNPTVGRLLQQGQEIIWNQDDRSFKQATFLLTKAMDHSPAGHPIRVICLKALAKIAREEHNWNLARQRLGIALRIAEQQLGLGHPQTLRVLEKMAKVCTYEQNIKPDGSMRPLQERTDPSTAVAEVYAAPIARAKQLNLPGAVAVMEGDGHFVLRNFHEAYRSYLDAERLLQSDDPCRKSLKEKRNRAYYELG
jgi:hypothetical protein